MAKRFHVSRAIAAPAERVWALLTDASSYRDWNPSVVSLDGAITPGGTIALVSAVNPKRTFKLKVTEMTAPTRMVWSDGMPVSIEVGADRWSTTGWRRVATVSGSCGSV